MLEYSLRAFKKKTDKGLCVTKIAAPNGYRAEIEGNRPASCLFMSDLQRFRDALLGYRFGVVRETLQPQDTREARSGGDPIVNFISVQSDPGRRCAVWSAKPVQGVLAPAHVVRGHRANAPICGGVEIRPSRPWMYAQSRHTFRRKPTLCDSFRNFRQCRRASRAPRAHE